MMPILSPFGMLLRLVGDKERSKQHTKMTKKKIAAKEAFAKRVKEQKEKQEKGS